MTADGVKTRVWYARTDVLEELLDRPCDWRFLWDWRKERIRRYKNREDKLRALGAGLLLYRGLYGRCGVLPEEAFSFGKNGKPELLADGVLPRVFFNVSHSGNYAAAVVSEYEAGIDVERLRAAKRGVAERFFSEKERAYLREHPSDEAFTRLWTRKESYVKATGDGIAAPFDCFCLLEEKIGEYSIKTYQIAEEAFLSVCVKGAADGEPEEVRLEAEMAEGRTWTKGNGG